MKKVILLIIFISFCSGETEITVIDSVQSSTSLTSTTTTSIQTLIANNPTMKTLFQPEGLPITNFSPFVMGPDCFISEKGSFVTGSFFDPNEVTFVLSEQNLLFVTFKVLNSSLPDGSNQLKELLSLDKDIESLDDYINAVEIDFFRVKIEYDNYFFDRKFDARKVAYFEEGKDINDFDYIKIPIFLKNGSGVIEYFVYFRDGSYLKSQSKLIISENSQDICIENNIVDINGEYKSNDNLIPIRVYKFDTSKWETKLKKTSEVEIEKKTKEYVSFDDNVKAFEEASFGNTNNNEIDISEFSDKLVYISNSSDLNISNIESNSYESTFFDEEIEIDIFDVAENIENSYGLSLQGGPISWFGDFEGSDVYIEKDTAFDYQGYLNNIYFEFHCTESGGALVNYGSAEEISEIAFSFCN